MGNTTLASMAATIDKSLAGDKPLTLATVDRFASMAATADVVAARMAYAVRERGIVGTVAGTASVTTLAERMVAAAGSDVPDIDRAVKSTRSKLSQWASAVAWLVSSGTPVDASTFTTARTLYGRGKSVRDGIPDLLKSVSALPENERAAAWSDALDTRKTSDDKGGDDGTGKRTPGKRATAAETRAEWIRSLDTLVKTAPGIVGKMTDAQNAHVRDALATLVGLASERRTTNAGSGRA